jgi:hypothetical protein
MMRCISFLPQKPTDILTKGNIFINFTAITSAQAAAHSKASTSACRMVHVFDAFVHGVFRECKGAFPLAR